MFYNSQGHIELNISLEVSQAERKAFAPPTGWSTDCLPTFRIRFRFIIYPYHKEWLLGSSGVLSSNPRVTCSLRQDFFWQRIHASSSHNCIVLTKAAVSIAVADSEVISATTRDARSRRFAAQHQSLSCSSFKELSEGARPEYPACCCFSAANSLLSKW